MVGILGDCWFRGVIETIKCSLIYCPSTRAIWSAFQVTESHSSKDQNGLSFFPSFYRLYFFFRFFFLFIFVFKLKIILFYYLSHPGIIISAINVDIYGEIHSSPELKALCSKVVSMYKSSRHFMRIKSIKPDETVRRSPIRHNFLRLVTNVLSIRSFRNV